MGADKRLLRRESMTYDPNSGVWQTTLLPRDNRRFFRFEVTLYHPVTDQIEVLEVTDPYSVSLSTNGRYSQLIDLGSDRLKPRGWDDHVVPELAALEDAVI